ncbi:MAG: ATP-dependent DNA ligase [Flavobacteriaceae bacterium]|nr:ATP-dependent DNA ligase [Flavobacteriaceae bacterium]|tara:strand:- start:50829 stop:52412 length:1584 start_codon:yes stop_codon:yes gene_type:complete
MKLFAEKLQSIEMTNKTNAKIEALVSFFEQASDQDKLWAIALFTGKRPSRPVKTTLLREWCIEVAQIPEWLFLESYGATGDLGETLALVLPPNESQNEKSLHQWLSEIIELKSKPEDEKKDYVLASWNSLDDYQRLLFNKFIGGSFRIGVSKKTLVNALAKYADKDPNQIMHSLVGNWHPKETSFEDLISGAHINYDNSQPYPFCLAYALDKELDELGNPNEWQVEYKWDGIRGLVIKRNNEVFIWSRGEELVTNQFPELVEYFLTFPHDFVIDGEILAVKKEGVLLFNDLQKRLNRKNVSKKMMQEIPVGFFAYDLLEFQGENVTQQSMEERRKKLEVVLENRETDTVRLSEIIEFSEWNALYEIRENARNFNSEGLMLKRKSSVYHVGRKKGDWFKWKVDPLTIDAVMIYAQRGSGRRSSKYTDYTFAVQAEDKLVTIAKAYSGLTDKEITEISRWVTKNEIEKFGPVRTVKPELVFEIAFEGIGFSKRHKSGVALRFPRIKRWRRDKTVKDIDTIESVKALIQN